MAQRFVKCCRVTAPFTQGRFGGFPPPRHCGEHFPIYGLPIGTLLVGFPLWGGFHRLRFCLGGVGGCYEFADLHNVSLNPTAQSLSHASRDSSLYTRGLGVNPPPHHCGRDFSVYGLLLGALLGRRLLPCAGQGCSLCMRSCMRASSRFTAKYIVS